MSCTDSTQRSSSVHSANANISVATFNVHGYSGKELEIEALASCVEVLAVCETWIRPQDTSSMKHFTECVSVTQTHGGWRGQGGLGLKINPLINYSVIYRHAQESFQVIIIKVGGTNIVSVYLTPTISREDFLKCLQTVHSLTVGPALMMGDLNCRHTSWDSKTNVRGKWLVEWAKTNKWSISAPPAPTFTAHQGSSTVDLVLSRGVKVESTSILHGVWDGCSDHFAVRASVVGIVEYALGVESIPHSQRRNSAYLKRASELYKTELPGFPEAIKSCSTSDDLERIYEELKEATLRPWADARKRRPKRFKYFWSRRLEYLKRQRSKKYRLASRTNTENAWREYRNLDKRIRYLVHKRKQQYFRHHAEAIGSSESSDSLKMVNALIRTSTKDFNPTIANEEGSLKAKDFTSYLATPDGEGHYPDIRRFEATPDMIKQVARHIRRAKSNKAAGVDELFSEAFKLAPEQFATILCTLWAKCSELGYLIRDWCTALMIPIHKSGPKCDPSNHRPISLISHARQMISGAIGAMIQEKYQFHETQLGFRPGTGTETAIIRHSYNHIEGYNYTAVLDLRKAYDKVPRDLLMARVDEKLPSSLANMIALELQKMSITTKGDSAANTAEVSIGVPQGGSSSPPLYNVHMDTLAEEIDKAKAKVREQGRSDLDIELVMFADDVKLQTKTAEGMQGALDVCTKWADQKKGEWHVKKCHVLEPIVPSQKIPQRKYYLAGKEVKVADSAEYLGVTLRGSRIVTDKNVRRVKVAHQRIGMLKAIGINRKQVPSAKLVDVCRTFIYPVADYSTHLMPINMNGGCELSKELERLDHKVVEFAIGCIEKEPVQRNRRTGRIGGRLPRHLKMAKLPDWLQRIRMRLRSLGRRLRARARRRGVDAMACSDPLKYTCFRDDNNSPKDMTSTDVRSAWAALCRNRRRRIPVPDSGPLPILKERDEEIRDAGIKWYTGSFPGAPDDLKHKLGPICYQQTKVRIETGMGEKEWNETVRKRTVESIGIFLSARAEVQSATLGVAKRGRKRKAELPQGSTMRKRCRNS